VSLGAVVWSGAWGFGAAVARELARVPSRVPGSSDRFTTTRIRSWRGMPGGPGIGAWGFGAAVARGLVRVPCRVPGSQGWFAKMRIEGLARILPRAGNWCMGFWRGGGAWVGASAVPGSGFMGLVRENADRGVGADTAAGWSGALTRLRNLALSAAEMACRRLAPRRYAGMISWMVFGVILLDGMDMQEDSD
jgi:hypothetical protein